MCISVYLSNTLVHNKQLLCMFSPHFKYKYSVLWAVTSFAVISSEQCRLTAANNNFWMFRDIKSWIRWERALNIIHDSFLVHLFLSFLAYLQYLSVSQLMMKWWKDGEVSLRKRNDCPWFSCFAATIPYGKGGQIEEAIGPHPTQTRPWILSTELSAKTLVLCEGRKKGDRKGGGEETWLGNLNGTILSHCMGVWAMVQSITDTALK